MKRLFVLIIVTILSCGAVFSQKKDAYRVRTVVIDPGHGGAKPGAQGSRSWEKNITLAVAKKFGKLIQDNYPDVKVIFTRTNDADISLAERARIANRNKADLFISIHANSHPTSSPTGVETFVMGLSESRANLEVAKKENADILLEADYKNDKDYAGFDPNSDESYIIFTIAQNAYLEKSLNFAQAIQTQYKSNLKTINRGVKQAELFVLYKTAMPSVLTEIGFISNPKEEAFMLSDEGQAKIALCLFNAFMNFKAAEEGSNRIANPVINIPGYKAPATSTKPTAEPKQVAQAEAKTEVKTEPTPQPQAAPKEEPKPEAAPPATPQPEAKPAPKADTPAPKAEATPETRLEEMPAATATTPQDKPLPPAALPPVQEQKATPTVAPAAERPQPQQAPADTKEEPAPTPAPEPENQAQPEEIPTLQPPQHSAPDSATSYYTVQFLTTPAELKAGAPQLGGITDFQAVKQGKYTAYRTGRFATFQEATDYCEHLKKTTRFKDAWAMLHRQPAQAPAAAPAETAETTAPAKQRQTTAKTGGVTYRIQFLTARNVKKVGDPDLQGIKDFHMAKAGRYYLYTAGNYSTQAEAEKRLETIRKTTSFKDAFVIAIHNGERISLEQAAAIKQKNKR